ncbi:MAG: UDP-N-acetylmuramate--L-alanine ligase [Myxococcota bacterium]
MQQRLSHLHFVGIGGIGMAALAELLHAQGFKISGSDLTSGPTIERLREIGIDIRIGHDAASLGRAEKIVRSTAIADDNVELEAARRNDIPIISRGALLAEVMRTKEGIAIAGSHGKTTTTAMTAHLLESAGLDPTALIGGRVPRPGGFASPTKLGSGDLLVAEVDESDGSFLLTRPVLAAITNVDPEHLDYYGSEKALRNAFIEFANSVPSWGAAILGIDHPGVREIAPEIRARQRTFGFSKSADLCAEEVSDIPGGQRCRVRLPGGERFSFDLPMPGRHNILNALAAIAIALEQGVGVPILSESFATFPGVARRFERRGKIHGIEVIDDYAHHPTEIRATLDGARSTHAGPITAIFQPHRYTRTRDCWEEFTSAFRDADRVVISELYAAGEAALPEFDGAQLAKAIGQAGHPEVHFGGSLADIERIWSPRFEAGELVMTLGAGDITSLGPMILSAIEAAQEDKS